MITTHLNADFDAMASMVAAKKLYPEALLVFPGSQERNLRDFFIRSSFYFVDFTRMKQVPLDEIKRLILVDTRQASRIGKFAEVAATGLVDIHIYDHHPDTDEDVHGSLEVVEEVGSTTAILTRIIRERGLTLSPPEATVMALGIFEDTGSFTFASTTPQDFEAGGFLLSQGADLNVVSEIVTRELNAEQVALLNDLLEHSTSFHVGGIEVVMARTTAPEYVPDFAVVAHRLMDVENIQVLFALAQMEDRVFVVGRSRLPEVDVAEILSELGGGGHSYAASATIKDTPLTQVEEKLRQILQTRVHPRRLAREIMSFPVKSVAPEVTLEEAEVILNRYNINALPVLSGSKLLGLISRQTVEKGIFHGLKGHQVVDYMNSEVATVDPDAVHRRDQGPPGHQQAAHPAGGGGRQGHRPDQPHRPAPPAHLGKRRGPVVPADPHQKHPVPDAGASAQGYPGDLEAGGPGGGGINLQRLRGGRVCPGPAAQT